MRASSFRVGTDIVYVPDIQDSLERFGQRFMERIFTADEQAYCLLHADNHVRAQCFAARFAAKEATIKVLRPTDTTVLNWRDIEVRRYPAGWCDIMLYEDLADLARKRGITELSVSMSHEKDYATAVVIADILREGFNTNE